MNRNLLKTPRKKTKPIIDNNTVDIKDIYDYGLIGLHNKDATLESKLRSVVARLNLENLETENPIEDDSDEVTSSDEDEYITSDEELQNEPEESILNLRMALERGHNRKVTRALRNAIQQGSRALEELHMKCTGPHHWHPGSQARPRLFSLYCLKIAMIDAVVAEILQMPSEQVLVDTHCLMAYDEYQIEVYKRLDELIMPTPRNQLDLRCCETQHLIDILRTAIATHNEFSDKNVRITKDFSADWMHLEPLMNDPNTIYMKYLSYYMYEMYYRRLDYSIATIILDNIHSLKVRLKLPEGAYQDIECALYYFIYRTDEDWLHYMPENRPKIIQQVKREDQQLNIKVLHDPNRILNGPVIYLEWKKFRKCLLDFDNVLANIDVKANLKAEGAKLDKSEKNTLTLFPYLGDEYSLKKMSKYLEVVDENDTSPDMMLVIQRVAQVTGEMLLSTDTLHLAPTTRALLNAELSKAPLNRLTQLRNELSKARDGKMLKKIQLEATKPELFSDLARDLSHIRNGINQVIRVYKPIVAKALVTDGLKLLYERKNQWHEKVQYMANSIEYIFTLMGDGVVRMEIESDFVNTNFKKYGYNRQLFREVGLVQLNTKMLNEEWEMHDNEIIKVTIEKLYNYIEIMKHNLNLIWSELNVWDLIIKDLASLSIHIKTETYPNDKCKQNINKEIKKIRTNNITKNIKINVLENLKKVYDRNEEWCNIKNLLQFIIKKVDIFKHNHYEIKKSIFSSEYRILSEAFPDHNGIQKAEKLLKYILDEAKTTYCEYKILPVGEEREEYKYTGIERLWDEVRRGSNECRLLECLCKRAGDVRRVTRGANSIQELQALWAGNERYRIAAEAAIADIHIVLAEAGLGIPAQRTPGQLLAEYPLRNMLQHGSALLEVLGTSLEQEDMVARLVLDVVIDEVCWRELMELRAYGVNRVEARQHLSTEAKKSPRWQRYLPLLPREGKIEQSMKESLLVLVLLVLLAMCVYWSLSAVEFIIFIGMNMIAI